MLRKRPARLELAQRAERRGEGGESDTHRNTHTQTHTNTDTHVCIEKTRPTM